MAKKIIAVFPRQSDAHDTIQDMLNHDMARQQAISVVAGTSADVDAGAEQAEVGRAGGAATGTSLALLTGLATLAIPGIGLALVGVPIATALGVAASNDDAADTRLQQVLRHVGLTDAEANGYAVSIRQGRTLVAVDVDDDQSGAVAALFRRHGGAQLEIRRLGEAG